MRKRAPHLVLLALVLALATAACGGSDESSGSGDPAGASPLAGAPIPGGGLTIAEALASELDGPLMVKGFLVAPDGQPVQLCSTLLESYPPQCGGDSLVVEGLDLATVNGLTKTDDPSLARVTWSDSEMSLLGSVEDGVLTVSSTSA